ncbi:MAG: stage II sporulation protein M [Clostridia bacterium]|nr:stage II sporulation protein M [Clostridia bacterium]
MIINHSNEQSKAEISGYINGFIDTIKSDNYQLDKAKLAKISIIENIKIVVAIWIAGSTVIGIPLIFAITAYKGFCIGYTISAIISTLGIGKRYCFFSCIIVFTKYYCNSSYINAKCKCI